jgi:hypothetical protein
MRQLLECKNASNSSRGVFGPLQKLQIGGRRLQRFVLQGCSNWAGIGQLQFMKSALSTQLFISNVKIVKFIPLCHCYVFFLLMCR